MKARYPVTWMSDYVRWRDCDGSVFDPWLRTHAGLGAKILGVCEASMVIRGSDSEWADWTSMSFPQSGTYVIDDVLVPRMIDVAADVGVYSEPNVWMEHPLR